MAVQVCMADLDRIGSPKSQVYRAIKRSILSGIYCKGDCLPSSREIAKHYAVDQISVSRALTELANDNLVEVRRGDGVYISGDFILFRFHEIPQGVNSIRDLIFNSLGSLDFLEVNLSAHIKSYINKNSTNSNESGLIHYNFIGYKDDSLYCTVAGSMNMNFFTDLSGRPKSDALDAPFNVPVESVLVRRSFITEADMLMQARLKVKPRMPILTCELNVVLHGAVIAYWSISMLATRVILI